MGLFRSSGKRMSSVIAKFMESVEPGRVMTRPMCNDDDGMLISQVVDSVMYIDKKPWHPPQLLRSWFI